ncbi:putative MACPF domain-containing protein CAD1/NSL1 [Helianthus annuus]|nr:putative MACPF domain-containing protein CAD1/NSL1 [Helianthus annuus]
MVRFCTRFWYGRTDSGFEGGSTFPVTMDLVSICKRRGGSDAPNLKHNEWLHSVQLEPDVITMSFIPITSLLNGVSGSGYLSHAINLYLRCEPHFSFYFTWFCTNLVNRPNNLCGPGWVDLKHF